MSSTTSWQVVSDGADGSQVRIEGIVSVQETLIDEDGRELQVVRLEEPPSEVEDGSNPRTVGVVIPTDDNESVKTGERIEVYGSYSDGWFVADRVQQSEIDLELSYDEREELREQIRGRFDW